MAEGENPTIENDHIVQESFVAEGENPANEDDHIAQESFVAEGENPTIGNDHIVRGTAASGLIRALAIDGTCTVREAQHLHGSTPGAANALGRLMMAAQMMGSLFKVPGEKLSLMVRSDGPVGGLTATADSEGHVKGYAENPQAGGIDASEVVGQGTLVVARESPHVEPYVSQIALADGTIANDLTAYYILSEQIPTIVGLGVLFDDEGLVARAGGYLIQLMPGYDDDLLIRFENALSQAKTLGDLLSRGLGPSEMLEGMLGSLDYQEYEHTPAAWRCDCGRERSERALISLGAAELQDMIDQGEPITITCDFCGKSYAFPVDELKSLRQSL